MSIQASVEEDRASDAAGTLRFLSWSWNAGPALHSILPGPWEFTQPVDLRFEFCGLGEGILWGFLRGPWYRLLAPCVTDVGAPEVKEGWPLSSILFKNFLSVEGIKIGPLLFVDVVVLLASSDCDLQLSLEQFVLLQCEELLSSQDESVPPYPRSWQLARKNVFNGSGMRCCSMWRSWNISASCLWMREKLSRRSMDILDGPLFHSWHDKALGCPGGAGPSEREVCCPCHPVKGKK